MIDLPLGANPVTAGARASAANGFTGVSIVEPISDQADDDMAQARRTLGAHGWR